MDPIIIGLAAIVVLLVLLFTGLYVAVALGIVGIIGIALIVGFNQSLSLLATTMYQYGTTYDFIITPLFIAMGLFSTESGLSGQIYDTAVKWLGKMRGGLGIATVIGCTIFGTLTGASVVTAMVFAKISVPEMTKYGYSKKLSYGLVCASGAIGMMIPPSLMAVIYALITELSVGRLLMAGIGPGLVLAACLIIGLIIMLTIKPDLGPKSSNLNFTWKERASSLPKLWPAVVVATVVIGGIYSGLFTVVEASGIGTFILFLLFLLSKGLSRTSFRTLASCLRETVGMSAMVLLLLITALLFGRLLVLSGIGAIFVDFLMSFNLSGIEFIIAATILYLILGCLMDGVSILVITIPLFQPVVEAMGIDPIWFAMVMILATQVGTITPPVGIIVFSVKGVAGDDISLKDLYTGVIPFFFMQLAALIIVIALPAVSVWIPNQIY